MSLRIAMKTVVNNKNKGLVIIAVLWTAVVLTVMAAVLGRKSRLDMKVCLARMEAVRCKWATRAGIEKAMAVLKEDDTTSDSLLDLWSDNDEDFNDVLLERCWFSVQVIDESSKLNINTATKEQLLGLPYMVEEIADAIIDWRDTDDTPSGMGVESGYYESLPYGYLARNGPFRTIRELLLVKDVTEDLFYGEDTNLNGRLDYNENDGDLSPPYDDADGMLDLGWAAYLTCYPSDAGASSSAQSSGGSTQTSGSASGQTSGTSGTSGGSGQTSTSSSQTSGGSTQSGGGSNQTTGSGQTSDGSASGRTSGGSGQSSGGSAQTPGGSGQASGGPGQTSGGSGQSSGGSNQASGSSGQTSAGSNQTSGGSGQTTSAGTTGQTSGKVNVNTASDIVLAALLGGGDDAERTALSIISYRETLVEGIQSVSELSEAGVVDSTTLGQIQDYLTTSSNVFTIRCTATVDRNGPYGTTLQTEAVVDRSSTPCKILFWHQEGN